MLMFDKGASHDCVKKHDDCHTHPDLQADPLPQAELTLFVDSYSFVHKPTQTNHTSAAVISWNHSTNSFDTVMAHKLPVHFSAQTAELLYMS